jgi:DNA-binding NtrC family response regulator
MKVGHRRILIVDPHSATARELSSLFIDEGYDVEISGSIKRSVEKIKDVKFDCVIMDVNLPDMKGYEAVPILKAIDPKVQVIMTAAENTMDLEVNVRKQEIFYYYIKSFDREELKGAVRDVFKKVGKFTEVKKMNKTQKVLVVDDDPSFVAAATPILESKGYKVEAAYDSKEAMEKIERLKPDLIVLDIMMERLSSWKDRRAR